MAGFSLQAQAESFLRRLAERIHNYKFRIPPHWDLDHLCYRVETPERYEWMKNELGLWGALLAESQVNGRPIATFKLDRSIHFREMGHDWSIDVIELPAPKESKNYAEGFEHAEFVCDVNFPEILHENPSASFDVSGLGKAFNSELSLSLKDCHVKFHHLSLESVIRIENNPPVFAALSNSRILPELSDFDPLLTGTFPLGIHHAHSDLDIVLSLYPRGSRQEGALVERLRHLYAGLPDFRLKTTEINGTKTLLANFTFQEVPFELFAQDRPSAMQRAFLHFLTEERLLKFGGAAFLRKITEARRKGVKTEPAFAEALALTGDPFEALLSLQKMPASALRSLLPH